jgi:hypothetical protein
MACLICRSVASKIIPGDQILIPQVLAKKQHLPAFCESTKIVASLQILGMLPNLDLLKGSQISIYIYNYYDPFAVSPVIVDFPLGYQLQCPVQAAGSPKVVITFLWAFAVRRFYVSWE